MKQLKFPFLTVTDGRRRLYGGDQGALSGAAAKRCGCGVVAAVNLLYYLHINDLRCKSAFFAQREAPSLTLDDYDELAKKMRRKFLPLFYPFGVNGLTLAFGINRFLRKFRLPYSARWGVRKKRLFPAIGEMLEKNIPVILSIGPNFPFLLGSQKLDFYSRFSDGSFRKTAAVCGHYVTVTGMDETHLRISSWGKEYFLDIEEFKNYSHKKSCNFLSNIVYLKDKERRRKNAV